MAGQERELDSAGSVSGPEPLAEHGLACRTKRALIALAREYSGSEGRFDLSLDLRGEIGKRKKKSAEEKKGKLKKIVCLHALILVLFVPASLSFSPSPVSLSRC